MVAGSTEESTRARVIDAAIECILDKGFYRASSNEIARAAGVTWGVIQHHFGSREALMVAVLEESGTRLVELVDSADISGATLGARLEQFQELIASYYGDPRFLAYLQIMLNLGRDPKMSQETARAVQTTGRKLYRRMLALEEQVVGDDAEPVLRGVIFHACRGLALSHLVLRSTSPTKAARAETVRLHEEQAKLIVRALVLLAEDQQR